MSGDINGAASPAHWLSSLPALVGGGSVSFVRSSANESVYRAFGAGTWESDTARDGQDEDRVAVLRTHGDGAIAVEPEGGYQGIRPEVLFDLARLSANGRSASVHWNVNGAVLLAWAERRTHSMVDLSGWDSGDVSLLPGPLRRWARGHNAALINDPVGSALEMASRFTEVTLSRVDEQHAAADQAYRPLEPRPPTAGIDTLDSTPLRSRDEELAEAIGHLPTPDQRGLAEWVTTQLLALARLDNDDAFRGVSTQFGKSRHPALTPTARQRIGRMKAELDAETRRRNRSGRGSSSLLDRLSQEHWTGYAVQYACHPDAATAAWRVVYASIFAIANAQLLDNHSAEPSRLAAAIRDRVGNVA